MKGYFLIFILALISFGCTQNSNDNSYSSMSGQVDSSDIPNQVVDKTKLEYDNKTSLWTLNNQLFSGYATDHFDNGVTKERFGILEGRKHGQALRWFPNGNIRHSANYNQGKLHGEKLTYSNDSEAQLLSHLQYKLGKAHGIQKKWYPTGEIFKILNLNMGVEEGIQQAFRKNGALYANYEAKDGRIYGLKKAALCFGLEEEKI